jgi:hypothetical protein
MIETGGRRRPAAPLRIRSELTTGHAPAEVWRCLGDLTEWSAWSPICRDCRTAEGEALEVGRVLVMRLSILGVTVTIRARVTRVDPPEAVGWEFRRFGVTASHTYRLCAQGTGTRIVNEELVAGLPSPLRALVAAWFASTEVSRRSLVGIRAWLDRAGATRS